MVEPETFSGVAELNPAAATDTPDGTTSDDILLAQDELIFAEPPIAAPAPFSNRCCEPVVNDCQSAAFTAGVTSAPCMTETGVPPMTCPLEPRTPPTVTVPALEAATVAAVAEKSRFFPVLEDKLGGKVGLDAVVEPA